MMRRLVERHRGILPLDTVESIWRVIIATFTYVQAPFSVHADLSAGDAAMRDSARFHFGFTVPFVPHMGAAGVVAAVSAFEGRSRPGAGDRRRRRRRLVERARSRRARPRSSPACRSSSAPIIRPALPVFVDRRGPRADAMVDRGRGLERAGRPAGARRPPQALAALAEVIAVPDRAFDGAALLVSVPQGGSLDDDHRGPGQGRRLGARLGPRRQPRDPLYGRPPNGARPVADRRR